MKRLCLYILISLIFFSCSKEKKKVARLEVSDKVPDQQIWDMDVEITDKNTLTARFKAGYVKRDIFGREDLAVSYVDSGLMIHFYKEGAETGILTSEKGQIDQKKELYTAKENVVFKSPEGYVMYTSELYWDKRRSEIYTPANFVLIKDEQDTLYGKGFIGGQNFDWYRVTEPIAKGSIEDFKITE